jgi:hypothetical protein
MVVRRAFEAWATSITRLADTHLSTLQQAGGVESSTVDLSAANVASLRNMAFSATPSPPMSLASNGPTPSSSSSSVSPPQPPHRLQSQVPPTTSKQPHKQTPTAATATTAVTPVSSFLSAKSVDPDGYPRSALSASSALANVPKTRSLAEIVGDEYFFVRLHAEFCGLLKALIEKEVAERGNDGNDDDDDDLNGNEDTIDEEEQRYEIASDEDAVQSAEDDDEACVAAWDGYQD